MTSFTPDERETTVTTSDGDGLVRIWTAQRKHITRMRRHPAFTETGTGLHGSSEWASFTVPADRWSPATGAKRTRELSEFQRQQMAERMSTLRRGDSSVLADGESEK